jgi:hypothetical protein
LRCNVPAASATTAIVSAANAVVSALAIIPKILAAAGLHSVAKFITVAVIIGSVC